MKKLLTVLSIVVLASTGVAHAYYIDHYERVSAHATDVYTLTFYGGVPVEVWVEGDGDTDLDCRVYDESGNLIDSDTDYTDACLLQWTPRWTGDFQLEIENLGSVWNGYEIEIR